MSTPKIEEEKIEQNKNFVQFGVGVTTTIPEKPPFGADSAGWAPDGLPYENACLHDHS